MTEQKLSTAKKVVFPVRQGDREVPERLSAEHKHPQNLQTDHSEAVAHRQAEKTGDVIPPRHQHESAEPRAAVTHLVILSDAKFQERAQLILQKLERKYKGSKVFASLEPEQKADLALFLATLKEDQLREALKGSTIELVRSVSQQACHEGVCCACDLLHRDHDLKQAQAVKRGMEQVRGKRRELLQPVFDDFARVTQETLVRGLTDRERIRTVVANRRPALQAEEVSKNVDSLLSLFTRQQEQDELAQFQADVLEAIAEQPAELLSQIQENFDKKHLEEELRESVQNPSSILGQRIKKEAAEFLHKENPTAEELEQALTALIQSTAAETAQIEAKEFKKELLKAGAGAVISAFADVRDILSGGKKNVISELSLITEGRRIPAETLLAEAPSVLKVSEYFTGADNHKTEVVNEARMSRVKRVIVDRDGRVWLCEGLINPESGNFEIEHREEIHLSDFNDLRFAANF